MPERMTVVVPTYRRPDLLRQCLEGLREQTRPADEVVVVARSTDTGTLDVIEGARDLPLRVVEPAQPGFVHALYAGMAAVQGGIAVMTDDDTLAPPDWLARYERAFVPGVVAVGGMNQVYLDGRPELHRTRHVGRLSFVGAFTGMHYARSGLRGVPVQHLQGCNMAFRAPLPLPDTALHGDGSYNELDMCLRLAPRGRIVYDERIRVDHHLGGRADQDGQPLEDALAARRETDRRQVADSCWNFTYVLSKNLRGRVRRPVVLAFGLLVGQRRLWGLARVAVESVRAPSTAWTGLLVVALRSKVAGWRAGTRAR